MAAVVSVACFQSLVRMEIKSESSSVVMGSLFGIANPEGDVVESVELANGWSLSWFFVIHNVSELYDVFLFFII